jgi:hypothetical protein
MNQIRVFFTGKLRNIILICCKVTIILRRGTLLDYIFLILLSGEKIILF